MSESTLQSAIVDALRRIGCLVVPNVVVKHRGRVTGQGTGSPDLMVVAPPDPRAFFIEVKTEEKASKVRHVQSDLHRVWRRAGLHIAVARTVPEAIKAATNWREWGFLCVTCEDLVGHGLGSCAKCGAS